MAKKPKEAKLLQQNINRIIHAKISDRTTVNLKIYQIIILFIVRIKKSERKKRMKAEVKKKKINIYDERNDFSLQQKEAVLVAFRISKLRELKNLKHQKLMENFLILVLQCGK